MLYIIDLRQQVGLHVLINPPIKKVCVYGENKNYAL
jgi:hypothetical protein